MHSPLSFCKIDVSFAEKLRKIVATTGEIFSLKFTKYPLAAIRGPTSKERAGREEGREGRGKGRGKEKGRGNLLQGVRGDRRPCV